jgi:hypothetical protein
VDRAGDGRPVQLLEFLACSNIWVLVRSSNLLLRPFHDSTNFVESKLTREDLVAMANEATTGVTCPRRRIRWSSGPSSGHPCGRSIS